MVSGIDARLRRLRAIHGVACPCPSGSVYVTVTPEQAAAIERDGPPEERCERCGRRLFRVYTTIDVERAVGRAG